MSEQNPKVYATRDITKTECPWLDNDIPKGFVLTEFNSFTYGCLGPGEIAVFSPGKMSFVGVPENAVASVENGIQTEEVVEDNMVNRYVIEATIPTK